MKKSLSFKSIRTKMIIFFSSLVLLTITIFMFFSIKYTKDNLMENSVEKTIYSETGIITVDNIYIYENQKLLFPF